MGALEAIFEKQPQTKTYVAAVLAELARPTNYDRDSLRKWSQCQVAVSRLGFLRAGVGEGEVAELVKQRKAKHEAMLVSSANDPFVKLRADQDDGMFWEYEVQIEIRTKRAIARCAAQEMRRRLGGDPAHAPQDCGTDELGNPIVMEQIGSGFRYSVGGTHDWPDEPRWTFAPREDGAGPTRDL